ncbi:class I SAM-dependent methyltransferase [Methyloglobulus sp.]|uniref:class I SAM-dependent methyltransferase n=1 Tax=Methyloglobulus sp. TaxID=2518622 RepID=UPI00398976B0
MYTPDCKLENSTDDFPYTSWERVYREHTPYELPWDSSEPHPLLAALFENHRAKPGSRALDLGCGTGASSRLLADSGYDVDAWDVSATAIERARVLSMDYSGKIRFVQGNVITQAFTCNHTYDLILDFLFLHHVQDGDIERYFRGVRKSLREGGRYVVGVFVQTGETEKRASLFSDGEVRYWTSQGIQQCLHNHFQISLASYGKAGSMEQNYPFGLFEFIIKPCP